MFDFICYVVVIYLVVGLILSLMVTQVFDASVDELSDSGATDEDLKEIERMRKSYTNNKAVYLLIHTLVLPLVALIDLFSYLRGSKR